MAALQFGGYPTDAHPDGRSALKDSDCDPLIAPHPPSASDQEEYRKTLDDFQALFEGGCDTDFDFEPNIDSRRLTSMSDMGDGPTSPHPTRNGINEQTPFNYVGSEGLRYQGPSTYDSSSFDSSSMDSAGNPGKEIQTVSSTTSEMYQPGWEEVEDTQLPGNALEIDTNAARDGVDNLFMQSQEVSPSGAEPLGYQGFEVPGVPDPNLTHRDSTVSTVCIVPGRLQSLIGADLS